MFKMFPAAEKSFSEEVEVAGMQIMDHIGSN